MNALQSVFGSNKTPEDLAREDAERCALEYAAKQLEGQTYLSEAYQKAMKTAARIVRSLKP